MVVVNDPIGDLLTRIRNAQSARRESATAPWSRMKEALCNVLKREGWIQDIVIHGEDPKKTIEVVFAPEKSKLELKRISTPGRRVYAKYAELKPVLRGYGIAIVTTSQGLMTDAEARAKKLGGEVLCTIA
jgi:small subunit ribosomal protein S8